MGKPLPVFYDCHRCPAYCCSYPRICLTPEDVARLSAHFGIPEASVKRRFTRKGYEPGEIIVRHQKDELYGSAYLFLDLRTRMCTVHAARPDVCREHPGTSVCAYYTFLTAERRYQNDPDFVARAYNPE